MESSPYSETLKQSISRRAGPEWPDASVLWVHRESMGTKGKSAQSPTKTSAIFLGRGGEGNVFGFGQLAIKVPRWSLLRFAGSFLSCHAWQTMVLESLGDLVLPFKRIPKVSFLAPATAEKLGDTDRWCHQKSVILTPKIDADQFLDVRFYQARGAEAARLIQLQHQLLEEIHRRGFVMVDFIMKNFVFYQGRLVVADAGMLIPAHVMRELTPRLTSWFMRRHLGRDYVRLLREKKRDTSDPVEHAFIDLVIERVPSVLKSVCAYRRRPLDPPRPICFPETCMEEFQRHFSPAPLAHSFRRRLANRRFLNWLFSIFSMQSAPTSVKAEEDFSHESI